ncbi:MAG: hypothetical protein Kow0045_23420 [Albidovulum sp.]
MQDIGAHAANRGAVPDSAWFTRLAAIGEKLGRFEWLGPDHAAFLLAQGPTLLVTFEKVAEIRQRQPGQLPLGYHVARGRGWSHLCLVAATDSWFRDPQIYAYFDRLVDDAFFDGFDRVVFYGAGMCGYAAAAYSVAAPGATVIAIQPQATLDPSVAGWDPRWPEMRRTSFTDRYGYAPDMIEGAAAAFILYDPEQNLDAMHAALFTRPFVTKLPCRNLGRDISGALDAMRVLPSILAAACSDAFDAALFWTFYRIRRNYRPYLQTLLARLEEDGRPFLAALLCRNVLSRLDAPRFRAKLDEYENLLAMSGVELPPMAHRPAAAGKDR